MLYKNTVINNHEIRHQVYTLTRTGNKTPKLLGQLRRRIRDMHYSMRTEEAYVYWSRWFIRFHGLRHPADMGVPEVQAFLSYLSNERKCSASTHKQALCALLFLYKHVLQKKLGVKS